MTSRPILALTIGVGLVVAACGGGDSIQVEDAWARTSASMQDTGAVYMTIVGGAETDDLIGVSVDSSVAEMAQLHMTEMAEGDDGSEVMSMHPVDEIAIAPGEQVSFGPGGYHIMLMPLAEPLVNGSEFDLVLDFTNAGSITITVEVRED